MTPCPCTIGVGYIVAHRFFGQGVVTRIETDAGHRVVAHVRFSGQVTRRLLLDYAPLVVLVPDPLPIGSAS